MKHKKKKKRKTLGLRCCAWAFSSCAEWGLLSSCNAWLLIEGFSCCEAQAPGARPSVVSVNGFSAFGSQAQSLRDVRNLPAPGIKPQLLALVGGFLSVPSGKSLFFFFMIELAIWGLLCFHICFRVVFFCICEKCYWNFDTDCTESVADFGLCGHLNSIHSSDS